MTTTNTPLRIKPRQDCQSCRGTGEVSDLVPYGATSVEMFTLCDCVLEQIPEGEEEREVEIITGEEP